jgi:hypothetical protein
MQFLLLGQLRAEPLVLLHVFLKFSQGNFRTVLALWPHLKCWNQGIYVKFSHAVMT